MLKLYRIKQLNAHPRIYALLGNPVDHSNRIGRLETTRWVGTASCHVRAAIPADVQRKARLVYASN